MPTYSAPVRDTLFVLNEVLGYERYANLPGFSDASGEVLEAILGEAAKFAENVMLPLNRVGDVEGCTRAGDGSVKTPTGFGDAYTQYREAGGAKMRIVLLSGLAATRMPEPPAPAAGSAGDTGWPTLPPPIPPPGSVGA